STEGAEVTLALTATDSTGAGVTFSADGLPAGLTMSSGGAISGALPPGSAGTYLVTVTATDNTYSNTLTFVWDVAPVVTITDPGPQTCTEGAEVSLALVATTST